MELAVIVVGLVVGVLIVLAVNALRWERMLLLAVIDPAATTS